LIFTGGNRGSRESRQVLCYLRSLLFVFWHQKNSERHECLGSIGRESGFRCRLSTVVLLTLEEWNVCQESSLSYRTARRKDCSRTLRHSLWRQQSRRQQAWRQSPRRQQAWRQSPWRQQAWRRQVQVTRRQF